MMPLNCLKNYLVYKKEGFKTKMKQVSIIIPFYNRETYLEECLNSIISSNCEDLELILIDDASDDSGADICKKYAETYNSFIHIITHEEREGPSAGRNDGIKSAKGKYLYFIDSDDFIVTEELENIVQILKDHQSIDLLLLDYQQILNGQPLPVKVPSGTAAEGLQTMKTILDNSYWNSQLPAQAWRFFVRRELVIRNQISFPDLLYGEDSIFSMKLFKEAENVYYHPQIFYNYRINNQDSLTEKANSDKWLVQKYFKERFQVLSNWINQDKESVFLKQWFEQWVHQCIREFLFEEEWKRMISEINESCLLIPGNYLSVLQNNKNNVEEYLTKYRNNLFERLQKGRNVYLLPACRDNVILAEKWKRNQIKVACFLDNNTNLDNHNLKPAIKYGYFVKNLKEKLKESDENGSFDDIYVICHWQKVINIIHKQLSESGISEESIIEIAW